MNDESDILSKHRSVGRSVVDISSIKERRKVRREGATMEGKKERAGREEKRMKRGAKGNPPQHTQVCNISRFLSLLSCSKCVHQINLSHYLFKIIFDYARLFLRF